MGGDGGWQLCLRTLLAPPLSGPCAFAYRMQLIFVGCSQPKVFLCWCLKRVRPDVIEGARHQRVLSNSNVGPCRGCDLARKRVFVVSSCLALFFVCELVRCNFLCIYTYE